MNRFEVKFQKSKFKAKIMSSALCLISAALLFIGIFRIVVLACYMNPALPQIPLGVAHFYQSGIAIRFLQEKNGVFVFLEVLLGLLCIMQGYKCMNIAIRAYPFASLELRQQKPEVSGITHSEISLFKKQLIKLILAQLVFGPLCQFAYIFGVFFDKANETHPHGFKEERHLCGEGEQGEHHHRGRGHHHGGRGGGHHGPPTPEGEFAHGVLCIALFAIIFYGLGCLLFAVLLKKLAKKQRKMEKLVSQHRQESSMAPGSMVYYPVYPTPYTQVVVAPCANCGVVPQQQQSYVNNPTIQQQDNEAGVVLGTAIDL